MSVTPADILASAKELNTGTSEVAARNAMSRAYYAAFHQARLLLPPEELDPNCRTGMHRQYIDQLMQADPGSCERKVAVKLSTLHGKRSRADYRLNEDIPGYFAAMQISAAEEVFQLLDQPRAVEPHEAKTEADIENASDSPANPTPRRTKLTRIR